MKKSEEWKTKYGIVSTISKKEAEEFENFNGEEINLHQFIINNNKKNRISPQKQVVLTK